MAAASPTATKQQSPYPTSVMRGRSLMAAGGWSSHRWPRRLSAPTTAPAVVDVWMLDGTTIQGERRQLGAGGGIANWVYGRLGDVVDEHEGEPARVAYADRPDVVNGLGNPRR